MPFAEGRVFASLFYHVGGAVFNSGKSNNDNDRSDKEIEFAFER